MWNEMREDQARGDEEMLPLCNEKATDDLYQEGILKSQGQEEGK